MRNSILISIDVFNPNQALLKYGVYTARNLGTELILFDAYYKSIIVPTETPPNGGVVTPVVDNQQQVKEARLRLAFLCDKLSSEWQFTKGKLITAPVPTWKGGKEYYIVEELKENKPSMVLMEIKSDFNLFNELLGTPETKVAEEMDCPVLLIPEGTDYSEITDINYLLERDKPIREVMKEVKFLKNMADNFTNKSTINLIYYFGDNKELADKELALKKSILIQELGYDKLVFINMSDHDIETAIHNNTKKYVADIFAFPNRDKLFLERLTNKDNTKRLILRSKIPVLVF